jgi:hypothetical protein
MSVPKRLKQLRKDKALRYRIEKWFWLAMVVPTVFGLGESTVYISLLSVYALFLGASSREKALEAAQAKR